MNKQEKKALETKLWWAIQNTENKLFDLRLQLSELSGEPDEILDAPEAPVLTDEQVLVLSNLVNNIYCTEYNVKNKLVGMRLAHWVCISDSMKRLEITDTGRAALKAHNERNAS